jgi:hypothetical protein
MRNLSQSLRRRAILRIVFTLCFAKKPSDDTNNAHRMQPIEIEGVPYCRIANNTGVHFDTVHHQGQRPDIDWKRVRSFCSRIFFPHEGPQRREIEPVMFDDDEFDENGRCPSEPGYMEDTRTLRRATTKKSKKDELEIVAGSDDDEEDDQEEDSDAEDSDDDGTATSTTLRRKMSTSRRGTEKSTSTLT